MTEMLQKVASAPGFIAALDQSGGSTPRVLRLYGIAEDTYSGDDEMFDLMHAMRSRIITSPVFNGERILGAILFEMTMDGEIEGQSTASYLWNEKNVVPFLKTDLGLADEIDNAQGMILNPDLDALCERAVSKGVFGTKMRSVINQADPAGVEAVVAEQFEVGLQILGHGLVPIIEPEVNINSTTKAEAEVMLLNQITAHLDSVPDGQQIMLKLTLPSEANFYAPLIAHPKVLRVVALSGGYSREVSNEKLAANNAMIASFSRALSEGLTAQMSDDEFNSALDTSIASIFAASNT
ncbi:MAG: fructose bisphosphate aldolase [Actinomycetia bacterium]|nr:fructose bisphosphate aldolase [Actinomycetes bacterium]MCP4959818.1 fructose bisphosphate aldolase [Actinomycetes bacterium]